MKPVTAVVAISGAILGASLAAGAFHVAGLLAAVYVAPVVGLCFIGAAAASIPQQGWPRLLALVAAIAQGLGTGAVAVATRPDEIGVYFAVDLTASAVLLPVTATLAFGWATRSDEESSGSRFTHVLAFASPAVVAFLLGLLPA